MLKNSWFRTRGNVRLNQLSEQKRLHRCAAEVEKFERESRDCQILPSWNNLCQQQLEFCRIEVRLKIELFFCQFRLRKYTGTSIIFAFEILVILKRLTKKLYNINLHPDERFFHIVRLSQFLKFLVLHHLQVLLVRVLRTSFFVILKTISIEKFVLNLISCVNEESKHILAVKDMKRCFVWREKFIEGNESEWFKRSFRFSLEKMNDGKDVFSVKLQFCWSHVWWVHLSVVF